MSIRNRRDAEIAKSLTLPAAGASANGAAIDLESVSPGSVLESIELEVAIPALANLADTKTVTVHLEDSADGSSFADIDALASIIVTGDGGDGSDASTKVIKLPSTTRRYVRAVAAVEAAGGDNTGDAITYDLLF